MGDEILGLVELQENLEWLLRKDLLEELVNLLELLQKSYINIYKHRLEVRGKDCDYVNKSKELFNKLQKGEIITKVTKIAKLINTYKCKEVE